VAASAAPHPNKLLSFDRSALRPRRRPALRPRARPSMTGPTGSGKTTTLATMIGLHQHRDDCHIITVGPIEYYHDTRSRSHQREVGVDIGFVLRGDPARPCAWTRSHPRRRMRDWRRSRRRSRRPKRPLVFGHAAHDGAPRARIKPAWSTPSRSSSGADSRPALDGAAGGHFVRRAAEGEGSGVVRRSRS